MVGFLESEVVLLLLLYRIDCDFSLRLPCFTDFSTRIILVCFIFLMLPIGDFLDCSKIRFISSCCNFSRDGTIWIKKIVKKIIPHSTPNIGREPSGKNYPLSVQRPIMLKTSSIIDNIPNYERLINDKFSEEQRAPQ